MPSTGWDVVIGDGSAKAAAVGAGGRFVVGGFE
jgi:hypothetical protein